ncbi:cytochrome P450 [Ramicandelaber brevisporus]|nr:cytochrome P450 [Ramicandelaber brevisporus]
MDRGLSFQFVFPKWMHGFLRDVVGFQPLVDIKRAAEFASERLVDRRRHMEALARGEKVDAIVNDNLQMLIDAVDPETGSRLTHDETVAEELVIMFAGTDTSANTMTWTVDLLFQHPEVFARLEAEILGAFPDPDERITYKAAKELLPYLDAVLLESMRLRTVAAAPLSRVVPSGGRDLAGYFFPADTVISASLHVMHNYSALWDEPSRFWPERFLDGPAEVVAERRQQVMPFSIGVRSCIGRQLALVEVVVGLATMIQQFEIRPAQEPYQPLEMHSVFVASPKSKSLMASIRPRRL